MGGGERKLDGFREYARHRGVTLKTVQEAIAAGRIIPVQCTNTGRTMIDRAAADIAWAATTDVAKIPVKAQITALERARDRGDDDGLGFDDLPDPEDAEQRFIDQETMLRSAKRFAKARADKEEQLALRAEMDNKKRAGDLVEAAKIRREIFGMGKQVKEALLNLPTKVAHEIAGETDPAKIRILLDKRIREALLELCGPEPEIEPGDRQP